SDLIRGQVRGIFEKSGVVPKVMLEAINRYANEQRTIGYFTLNAEAVGTIEAPSEDALRSFYEERKAQFMSPELRDVAVVAIAPETVAGRIKITEDDMKAEYAAKGTQYALPERRKIELIPYQTPQAAAAAEAALKNGKDFLEVAKEAGFKQS